MWVKIDDGFVEHPKIAKVGLIGAWLQLQALCYANRNLTDGFIPTGIADSFLRRGVLRLEERPDGRELKWTVGEHSGHQGLDLPDTDWPTVMIAAGLWEQVAGGYRIHDYDTYQPTKAEVLAERAKWLDRQRRHREQTVSRGVSRRDSRVTHASPVPVPVRRSSEQEDLGLALLATPAPAAPREAGFPEFWQAYPKKRHKPDALKAWRRVGGAQVAAAIREGVGRWQASEQWLAGRIEDPATFLNQRQWEDPVPAATRVTQSETARLTAAFLERPLKDHGR
jgi:hypothetical protein